MVSALNTSRKTSSSCPRFNLASDWARPPVPTSWFLPHAGLHLVTEHSQSQELERGMHCRPVSPLHHLCPHSGDSWRHFFSSDNGINNTNYCVVVLKCLALSTTLILANWTELNTKAKCACIVCNVSADKASVHGRQSGTSCPVCCGRRAQSRLSACTCSTNGINSNEIFLFVVGFVAWVIGNLSLIASMCCLLYPWNTQSENILHRAAFDIFLVKCWFTLNATYCQGF